MKTKTLNEILEVYDSAMPFYYYKDKYLLDMLLEKTPDSIKIADLKNTAVAPLLDKSWFKQNVLAKCGNGVLDKQNLYSYWAQETKAFNITLGKWGNEPRKHIKNSWYQTSRSGYNLVLQLNFCSEHNNHYYNLLNPSPDNVGLFNTRAHPVSKEKLITLGWVRLDLDFETDEVLIEEVQNDWLRFFDGNLKRIKLEQNDAKALELLQKMGIGSGKKRFLKYAEYLEGYKAIWDEALLSAAVWFVRKELQIAHIYMHTVKSGLLFKELQTSKPPVSLYSKLPKKMGFTLQNTAPAFLENEVYLKRFFGKAKRENMQWYKL